MSGLCRWSLLSSELLTRALYWFMIIAADLSFSLMFSRDSLWTVHVWSFTKFCHTLLISPLPLQPNMRIEHVTGKPAQYPRRMWKLRHSSVQWSVAHRPICLSMSEFCHALCLGDNKRNGCFFSCFELDLLDCQRCSPIPLIGLLLALQNTFRLKTFSIAS